MVSSVQVACMLGVRMGSSRSSSHKVLLCCTLAAPSCTLRGSGRREAYLTPCCTNLEAWLGCPQKSWAYMHPESEPERAESNNAGETWSCHEKTTRRNVPREKQKLSMKCVGMHLLEHLLWTRWPESTPWKEQISQPPCTSQEWRQRRWLICRHCISIHLAQVWWATDRKTFHVFPSL